MAIDDFLKRFVEGYLLHDLESMSKITLPAGQNDGAAGYPIIATVLAGMELLGNILMPNTDDFDPKNKSNDYFLNYWDNYFARQYPQYTGLGRVFRQLARNGIAHTFVAKPGIFVEKGTYRQTSIDTTRQEIYIDCNVFYKEFEDSYIRLAKPIIDGAVSFSKPPTRVTMQTRLDDINRVYSADSTRLFGGLPSPLDPSTINTGKRAQVPLSPLFPSLGTPTGNASGVAGPTTFTQVNSSATATMPSTTLPFITPSGTFPQRKP